MPEYIECEALKEDVKNHFKKLIDEGYVYDEIFESNAEILRIIDAQPTADVVEVVRCKDCVYFQPNYVLTNDGERRPYTDKEKEHDFGIVNMEKGINCGSRCERYEKWEENNIPVWCNENDFCSYGKRGD